MPLFDFFWLEGVQHVDDASELDRVNGPVRLPIVVLDHFENPAPLKPFEGLASGCLPPVCASKRACPTVRRTPLGNIFRSFLLDATQKTGFGPWSSGSSLSAISIMPFLACLRNHGFSRRVASGNEDRETGAQLVIDTSCVPVSSPSCVPVSSPKRRFASRCQRWRYAISLEWHVL